MDESLTAPDAQRKIYAYMSQALTGMPDTTSLSKTPDVSDLAEKQNRPPLPNACWDGNVQSDGPRYISSSYWVVGIPPSAGKEYFDLFAESWKNNGWKTSAEMIGIARVDFPDGFGIKLNAGPDYRFMSLTGYSPCMPDTTIEDMDSDPRTIPHP
ncbi:hypothetical protein [Nocardia caishijiensis]|uniref:hypothetical protein n=1 Tax=Nocardia caishijiensis TaxID=184756 RepID=UPI0012EE8173|nr:hypothetical protein [Nocardia caishijiensis]